MGCGSTGGSALERMSNEIVTQNSAKRSHDYMCHDKAHEAKERKKYKEKHYLNKRSNSPMQIHFFLLFVGRQSFVEHGAGNGK